MPRRPNASGQPGAVRAPRPRASSATRRRVGALLRSRHHPRKTLEALAEAHGVTLRTLRNWKRIDPAVPRARPGRPTLGQAVLDWAREVVRAELERQGWAAGEEPVWRGLDGAIPRARVRRVLAELKADRRRRHAAHAREARVSVTVLARDALWSLDATHLGREACGAEVQAEVLREVASTRTIGLSVGPPAVDDDIVRLLDTAMEERGAAPLVLVTDNGGTYRSWAVEAWCRLFGVVHLFSLPRTPQHNAASEHGMRELKEDADLGKGVLLPDIEHPAARLLAARDRIDGHRPRRTRGWRTAIDDDLARPHWRETLTRAEVLDAVSCGILPAVLHSEPGRARRRAIREAILRALQDLSVITRTRGGRAWTAQSAEDDS